MATPGSIPKYEQPELASRRVALPGFDMELRRRKRGTSYGQQPDYSNFENNDSLVGLLSLIKADKARKKQEEFQRDVFKEEKRQALEEESFARSTLAATKRQSDRAQAYNEAIQQAGIVFNALLQRNEGIKTGYRAVLANVGKAMGGVTTAAGAHQEAKEYLTAIRSKPRHDSIVLQARMAAITAQNQQGIDAYNEYANTRKGLFMQSMLSQKDTALTKDAAMSAHAIRNSALPRSLSELTDPIPTLEILKATIIERALGNGLISDTGKGTLALTPQEAIKLIDGPNGNEKFGLDTRLALPIRDAFAGMAVDLGTALGLANGEDLSSLPPSVLEAGKRTLQGILGTLNEKIKAFEKDAKNVKMLSDRAGITRIAQWDVPGAEYNERTSGEKMDPYASDLLTQIKADAIQVLRGRTPEGLSSEIEITTAAGGSGIFVPPTEKIRPVSGEQSSSYLDYVKMKINAWALQGVVDGKTPQEGISSGLTPTKYKNTRGIEYSGGKVSQPYGSTLRAARDTATDEELVSAGTQAFKEWVHGTFPQQMQAVQEIAVVANEAPGMLEYNIGDYWKSRFRDKRFADAVLELHNAGMSTDTAVQYVEAADATIDSISSIPDEMERTSAMHNFSVRNPAALARWKAQTNEYLARQEYESTATGILGLADPALEKELGQGVLESATGSAISGNMKEFYEEQSRVLSPEFDKFIKELYAERGGKLERKELEGPGMPEGSQGVFYDKDKLDASIIQATRVHPEWMFTSQDMLLRSQQAPYSAAIEGATLYASHLDRAVQEARSKLKGVQDAAPTAKDMFDPNKARIDWEPIIKRNPGNTMVQDVIDMYQSSFDSELTSLQGSMPNPAEGVADYTGLLPPAGTPSDQGAQQASGAQQPGAAPTAQPPGIPKPSMPQTAADRLQGTPVPQGVPQPPKPVPAVPTSQPTQTMQ